MTKNTTRIFNLGDQVRMVSHPNYNPADHSKDVTGIVGVVTNIDKHFTYESLWLYAVTFPRYHEYKVFRQEIPPVEVEEEITLTFWNEQIERVEEGMSMKDTLQAQDVQNVIREQIARREKRIDVLRQEARQEIISSSRLVEIALLIDKLSHAVGTLIELEHVLRLCGCPDEAYASKEKG